MNLADRLEREVESNLIAYLLLICVSKNDGKSYGYQMRKFIEELVTKRLSEGTLYTLLAKMADPNKYGLFDSYLAETTSKRQRRYYTLTTKGERELEKWLLSWKTMKEKVDDILDRVC